MSEKSGAPKTRPPRGPADPALGGISMIFLVHNEAFIIEPMLRNYLSEFQGRVPDLEVIVAEDGSRDDTKAVLERLARELPIKLYTSDARKGYSRAMLDALSHATQPWVFFADSDYQFAAVDFWLLDPWRRSEDIILGIRSTRNDPFYRVWIAWIFNFILRVLFKVPFRDMDAGFRLLRRSMVEAILPQLKPMLNVTAEMVIRAHHAGYRICEVPVQHFEREFGGTKTFHVSKLAWICLEQFFEVLKLKRELMQVPKAHARSAPAGECKSNMRATA